MNNSPRRAKSTPAGVIHSAPCIRHPYFQKANGKVFAKAVTSMLRNLIYSSDAFASFRIKCVKFWIKFHAEGRKRIRRFMNIPRFLYRRKKMHEILRKISCMRYEVCFVL
ncbi:hypothetical protein JO41_02725 [Treponema sp. OMZ 838]|nr:hypothetical protein JO41_02725 [Treponema sp. OMZ 838]